MATFKPQPLELIYDEINKGKFSTVKHYELVKSSNLNSLIPKKLNIGENRNCARSKPVFWLKIWLDKKWSKPVTGLFNTSISQFHFSGDLDGKTHFLIFHFSKERDKLKILMFPNYFPFDKQLHPATVGKSITKNFVK
jgi:hypothetical protein